jgi:hypothetical protein
MSEPDESPPPEPPPAGPGRPWQPPQIKSGQLFESNSLACFKTSVGPLECSENPPFQS